MKLLIVGPQASGKGTQSTLLAKEFGYTVLSTGEKLREEVASGSRLGLMIKEKIDKGELVPDEFVEAMVKRFIDFHPKFIIDGFPRTEKQAQWLDSVTHIDKVILLNIADKTAIERITGRRECPKGHNFHLVYNPPKKSGICDECGLPLKKRDDDNEAIITKRLKLYHEQTVDVLRHYKSKVLEINGEQSIKEVHLAIVKALHKH